MVTYASHTTTGMVTLCALPAGGRAPGTPTSLLRHSSMHASLSLSSRMASLELLGRDDKRSG